MEPRAAPPQRASLQGVLQRVRPNPQMAEGASAITQIYEGTNQVQRIVMARNLP
ncbi:hypothetical protein ACFWDF_33100 [Streptomyces diastaticus]|uniref:hypothetical protein n=1 Tax=Streptomyces diastaticus TaxID=1956 RepID=UPI0036A19EAB